MEVLANIVDQAQQRVFVQVVRILTPMDLVLEIMFNSILTEDIWIHSKRNELV